MADGHYLTPEDVELLKELAKLLKNKPQSTPLTPPTTYSNSPEVYVVQVPSEGIPALEERGGTGTGTDDIDRTKAVECSVFGLQRSSQQGKHDVKPVGVYKEFVHNVLKADIPAGFTLAIRDAYGNFIAIPNGVDATAFRLEQDIDAGSTGTGTGDGISATLLEWDFMTTKEENALVLDNGGIFSSGTEGANGVAIKVDGQWHIFNLECSGEDSAASDLADRLAALEDWQLDSLQQVLGMIVPVTNGTVDLGSP